jgi:hypothetical protein
VNQENKAKIEAALAAVATPRQATQPAEDHGAFHEAFDRMFASVLRPTIEALRASFEAQGFTIEVTEDRSAVDARGGGSMRTGAVGVLIARRHGASRASLQILPNTPGNLVDVKLRGANGSIAGQRTVALAAVTEDELTRLLVRAIESFAI